VPHIIRRLLQETKRNVVTLPLINLGIPVFPNLLQSNINGREYSTQAPSLGVVHIDQAGLTGADFAEDDYGWAGGVDCGALIEKVVCGPGVAEPGRMPAAGPKCYDRIGTVLIVTQSRPSVHWPRGGGCFRLSGVAGVPGGRMRLNDFVG
jgi:hypothetical protein